MMIRIGDIVLNTDFIVGVRAGVGVVEVIFDRPIPDGRGPHGNVVLYTGESATAITQWMGKIDDQACITRENGRRRKEKPPSRRTSSARSS